MRFDIRIQKIDLHQEDNGDAASEIVRIAEEENVDMIVIATYGMTGWRRVAFGSVAERVVRLAKCPVLTTRVSLAEP